MTKRRSRTKRIVVVVTVCTFTIGAISTALWICGDHLWARWKAGAVRGELAAENFLPTNPGPECEALFGDPNLGALVWERLLEDGEYRVWTNLVALIDSRLNDVARGNFISYLRESSSLALVRYLLIQQYSEESKWRGTIDLVGLKAFGVPPSMLSSERTDDDEAVYWTGSTTGVTSLSSAALDFLGDVLANRIGYERKDRYRDVFHWRAIAALVHALPRGERGQPLPEDLTLDAKHHRVLELLDGFRQKSRSYRLRYMIAARLRTRSGHFSSARFHDVYEVKQSISQGLRKRHRNRLTREGTTWKVEEPERADRPELPVLIDAGHPRTIEFALDILEIDGETRPLHEVIAGLPRSPYSPESIDEPVVEWNRADHTAASSCSEYAAMLAARLGDLEALATMRQLATAEKDPDRELILESAIARLSASRIPAGIFHSEDADDARKFFSWRRPRLPRREGPDQESLDPPFPFFFGAADVQNAQGFSSQVRLNWLGANPWMAEWLNRFNREEVTEQLFRQAIQTGDHGALEDILFLGAALFAEPTPYFELVREAPSWSRDTLITAYDPSLCWPDIREKFLSDPSSFEWNPKTKRWRIRPMRQGPKPREVRDEDR